MSRPEESIPPRVRLFGEPKRPDGRGPSDELAPQLGRISDDVLWGQIWADPTLDLRTRSLCTFSALCAMGRFEYVSVHARGARRLGVSREEMSALAMQLMFYVGIPVTHRILAIVKSVYDEDPAAVGHNWPATEAGTES